jgi:septum formation protein
MLVLASASPRRQDILNSARISFTAQPANIDETPHQGEQPREHAERLAREKALAVWRQRPHDTVLGADTIVVVDQMILGKPTDTADAVRMLRMLSGRTHQVITGICLVHPDNAHPDKLRSQDPVASVTSETTLVVMNELPDKEIQEYVETGEPMDKAGAYAIQGMASRWIPRIEGDYSNVVGLPVALVYRLLREEVRYER